MKAVFMGTMDFAVPILEGLYDVLDVALVVTQPDRPFGRKKELKASSVKVCALAHGTEVFQPENIRKEYEHVLALNADIIIVAAYGQMIPNIVLETPRYGCINVHASLLPKYRGGAPMHKAIQHGETSTGVTVMKMAMKMDSGPLYAQRSIPIEDTDDVGTLQEKLGVLGRDLLLDTLPEILSGKEPVPQDESLVTFAYNIKREEEHLSFDQPARNVFNHVRGYHPWPLTYAMLGDVQVKFYEVSVHDETRVVSNTPGEIIELTKKECLVQANPGIISLEKIQLQGKKALDIRSFLAGNSESVISLGKIFK